MSNARSPGDADAWPKTRHLLLSQVIRIPGLSPGAKLLWAELALNWAWKGPECFPRQDVIATALDVHVETVVNWLKELVGTGLVDRRREGRHNYYTLCREVPARLLSDGWRFQNTQLTRRVRSTRVDRPARTEVPAGGSGKPTSENPMDSSSENPSEIPMVDSSEIPMDQGQNPSEIPMHEPSEIPMLSIRRMKHQRKEKHQKNKLEPAPASPAVAEHSGMRGLPRASRGNEGSGALDMAEADDLLQEHEASPARVIKRRPKNQAPSTALVSWGARFLPPFPEALGAPGGNANVVFDSDPPPPPVETPMDLVWLLKGEIQRRWERKGFKGFAEEITAELQGKLTNAVLRKYTADVILKMVRVLVWDWEVARGVCWPNKKDLRYPTIESLAQYASELASRIETGFDYMATRRGALNTYHDLFIRKIPFIPDDDPF